MVKIRVTTLSERPHPLIEKRFPATIWVAIAEIGAATAKPVFRKMTYRRQNPSGLDRDMPRSI
jgi:hypothetical protein